MKPWLASALAYVASWREFQRRHHDQPGCAVAIASGSEIVLEAAFGSADIETGEALTPRHGFRIASHSKTFTAAGILRLVEAMRKPWRGVNASPVSMSALPKAASRTIFWPLAMATA